MILNIFHWLTKTFSGLINVAFTWNLKTIGIHQVQPPTIGLYASKRHCVGITSIYYWNCVSHSNKWCSLVDNPYFKCVHSVEVHYFINITFHPCHSCEQTKKPCCYRSNCYLSLASCCSFNHGSALTAYLFNVSINIKFFAYETVLLLEAVILH